MKTYIHHIETLLPLYCYPQEYIREKMEGWLADPVTARLAKAVFRRSGIERRYSVLPDLMAGHEPRLYGKRDAEGKLISPSTGERNRVFTESAGELSVEVARSAIKHSKHFTPADITHVITASCTGFYNPGPDFQIVQQLDLSPATERYHIGFMGCYAAFPALRMARQFCQAQPDAVVLVVCLELCTLHMQIRPNPDSLLANAIFADGVGAAIVSSRPPSGEAPVLAMDQFMSATLPEGGKDMAWEIGDEGFNIVLSSYVPDVIGSNIEKIVEDLLVQTSHSKADIHLWAVHPGGKAILDKVEKSLSLTPPQLASSRQVLAGHGNMSSATILFVLKHILETSADSNKTLCSMAFGPGLVVETALLSLIPSARLKAAEPSGETSISVNAV